jgi:transcriptional regulator with GAF, ATPase, and Fis domain
MEREAQLNETFVELADTLVRPFDVDDVLHTLATRCVDLFDVDGAGLVLADQAGALHVIGSSMEQARMLELFEVQNQEGPCLDCYRTGELVAEENLESGSRWPRFAAEAVAAGFHSVHAVPMRLRTDVIGALNLFRIPAGSLGFADLTACQALADVATISLLQDRAVREARLLAGQLQVALNNRIVIEQAKGVLSERAAVDMDAAFQLMRAHARSHNRHLADVAHAVIEGLVSAGDFRSPGA